MIKINLIVYCFLYFISVSAFGQLSDKKILFMGYKSNAILQNDFQYYSELPAVFQIILNNDLESISKMTKQELNKKFSFENITFSPLMFVCKHAKTRESIAHFLIDQKADINFRNNFGETALSYLAFSKSQDTSLAKRLLIKTIFLKKDKAQCIPLEYAIYSNNIVMFKYLLSEYLKEPKFSNSDELKDCLRSAMNWLDEDRTDLGILEEICKTIDIRKVYWKNWLFKRPIDEAVQATNLYNGKTRLYILEHVPKDDSLDIKLMNVLINHGLDINQVFENNQNILFKVHENKPLLKFLSTKMTNINMVDSLGNTFLQFYIQKTITPPIINFNDKPVYVYSNDRDYSDDYDFIAYLIKIGAKVNTQTKEAIQYLVETAINKKNYFILKFLFKKSPELLTNSAIKKVLNEQLDSQTFKSIIDCK